MSSCCLLEFGAYSPTAFVKGTDGDSMSVTLYADVTLHVLNDAPFDDASLWVCQLNYDSGVSIVTPAYDVEFDVRWQRVGL